MLFLPPDQQCHSIEGKSVDGMCWALIEDENRATVSTDALLLTEAFVHRTLQRQWLCASRRMGSQPFTPSTTRSCCLEPIVIILNCCCCAKRLFRMILLSTLIVKMHKNIGILSGAKITRTSSDVFTTLQPYSRIEMYILLLCCCYYSQYRDSSTVEENSNVFFLIWVRR